MKSRRTAAKRLDSLGIMEILDFTSSWHPPIDERSRSRWPTWEAYFRDYDLIRGELLASEYVQPGTVLFADRARELLRAHPDHIWEAHRHAALQHAHLYKRGDGHVHEDCFEARLGPAVEIVEIDKVPIQVVE